MTEALLFEWARCWTEKDGAAFSRLFGPGAIYEDMALPHRNEGNAAVDEFFTMTIAAFPDFNVQVHRAAGNEHTVAGEWTMTGTHMGDAPGQPATGKTFRVNGSSVIQVQDGLIVHHRDYWDLATMNRQLGLPVA